MYKGKKILGVIPARGGSKGIPKKNIKDLDGLPLIFYTINESKNSQFLSDFIVSTDDDSIKEISEKFGAKVINRPSNLALDDSRTEDCLIHAINYLDSQGIIYDYVVVLEPTSPFRKFKTIDNCIKMIIDKNAESLLTVYETKECIGEINNSGFFNHLKKNQPRRRQDREPLFVESSTLYIVKKDFLLQNKSLVCKKWLSYIIDKKEAIDINTMEDFEYANFLKKREY